MRGIKIYIYFLFLGFSAFAQSKPVLLQVDSNAVKDFYFAGLRDKLTENYESATQNFNKALAIDAQNDALYFELAVINYYQAKLVDAEVMIKSAINFNKNNVWYYKFLVEVYKRKNRIDELPPLYNEIIRLEPFDEDVYFDRSEAWQLLGNFAQAEKGFDEIESKFGDSEMLREAKEALAAQKQKHNSVATNGDELNKIFVTVDALTQQNKTAEAIVVLAKAKQSFANAYQINVALANCYLKTNNLLEAIKEFDIAFAQKNFPFEEKIKTLQSCIPQVKQKQVAQIVYEWLQNAKEGQETNPQWLVLISDFYYQTGNYLLAKQVYEKMVSLNYQSVAVWEKRIETHLALNEINEALKTADEALSIYPNQASLYYLYALALHLNNENKQALENIKISNELNSEDKRLAAKTKFLEAEIAIDENKLSQASDCFEKAISLDENNPKMLNSYAYYLALRDFELEKSEKLISKAEKLDPEEASILDTYAYVLLKRGKYAVAKKWIEKALTLSQNPIFIEHYGDILFLNGEKEQAIIQWKKANQEGNKSEKLIKKINEEKYIK